MLDEAIEYLKSLQLQVQVSDRDSDLALSSPHEAHTDQSFAAQMMWMGSGIAAPPVMFPGVHQYLPRMGVGMGAAAMPFMPPQPVVPNAPVHNPVPLSPAAYRGHMPARAARGDRKSTRLNSSH